MTRTQSSAAFSFETNVASSRKVVPLPGSQARILITENMSSWSDTVMKRLEELIQLPNGWDGYQGIHVSFENANFAIRMLDAICGLETPAPQIVPGVAGDLQIEWHTLNGDIELHVRAPNDVHAWRAISGQDPDGEDLELTNDFANIAQWVKEITELPIATNATAT